jgi:hypothetical protein
LSRYFAVLPCILFGVACGPKATFLGGVYSNGSVRYRVGELPSRWTRVDVEHGQVNFMDRSTGATILSHAECGRGDAPLRALTAHLLIGMTSRRVLSQERFDLARRAALRTRIAARVDGVPVELEIVVVKKDGCSFDFVYSAPPARFGARRADFDAFVRGFSKLRTPADRGAAP